MLASRGIDGGVAERAMDAIGLTANKNAIPNDTQPPFRPSGVRLGTPAITTRGLVETDMARLATWIEEAIDAREDAAHLAELHNQVSRFSEKFPLPSDKA
jgi:glycine hydroxymethyltransferase